MADRRRLVLGAVAYDPKTVTIWEGFKAWLEDRGLPFDYVLYSNYEALVEDLLDGRVDVAWNSPLAWVRARRLAAARGMEVHPVLMRDTDCDLTSVVVGGPDVRDLTGLAGRAIGVGAIDSPQATMLPLAHLRDAGLDVDGGMTVRRFDVLGGKHGDHVGGERDAAIALAAGEVDAACMIEGNYEAFLTEGILDRDANPVVTRTPPFDHCNFTATDRSPAEAVVRFRELLLSMSFDDPEVRPLLELEGLRAWREGRRDRYAALESAVDAAGFYSSDGAIAVAEYRY